MSVVPVYAPGQLVEYNNTSLLKPNMMYATEAGSQGFELSPHYASGIVYTSTVLDMVLCQVRVHTAPCMSRRVVVPPLWSE